MILLLKCPHCGNNMKYASDKPSGKQKRCVYCGKSYSVTDHIVKKV